MGAVGPERRGRFGQKMSALASARGAIGGLALTPPEALQHGIAVAQDGQRRSAMELLAYPGVSMDRLAGIWPQIAALEPAVVEQIEIDAHYAGYLDRQDADIRAFRRDEELTLPHGLDYAAVGGLSNEVRGLLLRHRPETLGQAARISGVTPAALTALLGHVKRRNLDLSA